MQTTTVHLSNGDHYTTGINGTPDEVKAYFLGPCRFQTTEDPETGKETVSEVVRVEIQD